MGSIYERAHGVAFGFTVDNQPHGDGTAPTGRILTDTHSFRDFGLYPADAPTVEPPEVNVSGLYVPGADGEMDFTETLDGVVHFKNRKAVFTFRLAGPENRWVETYHRLLRELHGREKRIVLDDDPNGYYLGRLTVEKPKIDAINYIAHFTIRGNLQPYQYNWQETGEPWLWRPFRFTRWCLRRPYRNVLIPYTEGGGPTTVTVLTSDLPVTPNIWIPDKSVDVTGADITYTNVYGDEKTVTVRFSMNNTALFSDCVLCALRAPSAELTVTLLTKTGATPAAHQRTYNDDGTWVDSGTYAYLRINYQTGRL